MKNASLLVKIEEKLTFFGVFGIFVVLGFLISFFYSPVIKTHAADTTGETTFVVGVEPTISLSLDRSELNLTGTMNSFTSGLVNASVVTNSIYGYTLGLEDKDQDTRMHHEDSNISDVVTSSFVEAKTVDQMEDNTWGYSFDGDEYFYVPTYGIAARLKTTYEPTWDADVTPIYFGVKVGVLTSGRYSDTVMFSAYVNGPEEEPEDKIYVDPGYPPTMQSFGQYDCNKLAIGTIITLTDSRDGKSYRILKTGSEGNMPRCIMIDNLSLETSEPLYRSDTDITSIDGPTVTMRYASSESDFITRVNNGETNLAYIDPVKGGFYTKLSVSANNQGSICPSGWFVPASYMNLQYGDYYPIFHNYFNDSIEAMREYFPATDGYIDPAIGFTNATTRYWGSSQPDYNNVILSNSGMSTGDYVEGYGVPLRCIRRINK